MQTIYCLSGLGANEKVFQFLDLSFAKPVFIQWLPPRQNETLRQYALRLKEEYITEPEPVIFGLSLGGMMAVEIAKVIPSSTAILISSAKTKRKFHFTCECCCPRRYTKWFQRKWFADRKKFNHISWGRT
jgi:pimeloyl-ACP methyl ester carboxylesterase